MASCGGGVEITMIAKPKIAKYALPRGGSDRLRTTFTNHISSLPSFTGKENSKLKDVMECIQGACKKLSRVVKQSGVVESYGSPGSVRWDQLQETAEDLMKKAILSCPWVCAAVSPLGETIMVPRSPHAAAEFVVVWDAMDGTSNLHAGVNTATIFGIYRRLSPAGSEPELRDALQPPSQLLCAGYAMYAAGTRLILASETGADCYVLDDDLGHFVLSAKRIRIPERGSAYSVNEGNSAYWDEPTRSIVAKVKLASQPPGSSEKIRLRYVGTMVADVHRTLLHGGLFMYPADSRSPSGKLRLLYEAGPVAYVFSKAGGLGSSGAQSLMSAQPVSLHQRTPVFLGSCQVVSIAQDVYACEILKAIDNVSAEREWVGQQRLQINPFRIDPCACSGEPAMGKRIQVPGDFATLPEAIEAAGEAWREELASHGGAAQPPLITLKAGQHTWQGTMQVKPGTVVVVEGEPGAQARGHWWMHAGSGGSIRGLKLESVDNHVVTAYGGCWLLEDLEVSCLIGEDGACDCDDDYYEGSGTVAGGKATRFEAVQTFGQSCVVLRRCKLGGGGACGVGVFAYNNSCCCLEECVIRGPADHCVYVGNNAVVKLERCTLEGEERAGAGQGGLGMLVEHSGSALLRECELASCLSVKRRSGGETSVLLDGNTMRGGGGMWWPADCRPGKFSEVGTKVASTESG